MRNAGGEDARGTRLAQLIETAEPRYSAPRSGDGTTDPVVTYMARLCSTAMAEVGVSGAGVTVMGTVRDGLVGERSLIHASGRLGRLLEDLQLTTGQGPCLEAFGTGAPVLVGDLDHEGGRWPGFAPDATAVGAAAVFSFPLQVGAARLGTLDLHRVTPGPLGADEMADALLLAQAATEALLERLDGAPSRGLPQDGPRSGDAVPAGEPTPATPDGLLDVHAEVHQASGMVSEVQSIPVTEALLRIRAHAYTHSTPITVVAEGVLAQDVSLDSRDDTPGAGSG